MEGPMERSFSHTLSFENLQVLVLSALACCAPSSTAPAGPLA
jgi:hypothetical protein